MDGRRSALIVLDAAHVTLGEALVDHEEHLGGHLSTEERSFFRAVTTLDDASGTGSGTRGVAVALVLKIREVLGKSEGLDR